MKIIDSKSMGQAIRERRKELEYTQAFLAEFTGLSVSFISDLERGKATAEIGKIIELLHVLGMDILVEKGDDAMRKLSILIERNGKNVYAGDITGDNSENACFTYAEDYINAPESRAVSISLPLTKRSFDAQTTRNFFEGLLPEGFTRRCVAKWMHTEEQDYLSILAGLGRECLGAIKVIDESVSGSRPEYRKLTVEEVQKLAKEGAEESAGI